MSIKVDWSKFKHLVDPEPDPRRWQGPLRDWQMVDLYQKYVKQRKLLRHSRWDYDEYLRDKMREIKQARIDEFEANWPLFKEIYEERERDV